MLDIRVPGISAPFGETELITQLFHLWPQFEGFIISFLMIGAYWIVHHRVFHYIKRYDFPFVWLNLIFLLLIVLTPFPTSMLTKHDSYQVAVVFYATSMVAIGVMLSLPLGTPHVTTAGGQGPQSTRDYILHTSCSGVTSHFSAVNWHHVYPAQDCGVLVAGSTGVSVDC